MPDEPDTPVTPPTATDFSATLGLPEKVENIAGTTFNGVVSVNGWDNEGGFKLIDLIVEIPEGLTVTNVTAGNRLVGGTISYHLASDGKLRTPDMLNFGALSLNRSTYTCVDKVREKKKTLLITRMNKV